MAKDDEITARFTYTPPAGAGDPIVFESTSDMGLTLLNGVKGLGKPPVKHFTAARAHSHGSVRLGTRLEEREIFLPLLMDAETVNDLDIMRDSLIERLNPLKGEGTLKVERIADGQKRTASVIYKSGLEGDMGDGYRGVWETFGVTFLMCEAFWEGSAVTISWPLASTDKPFLSRTVNFFPVIIGRTHIQGTYSLDIAGDADAYPVWTITGPATDIEINNRSTGQRIQIMGEIRAGETITINTRDDTLTGTTRSQDELWDALTMDSTLFPLSPGRNDVEAIATGLTTDSKISATYRQRFLAGY